MTKIKIEDTGLGYAATVTSKTGSLGPFNESTPDESLGAAVRELYLATFGEVLIFKLELPANDG